MVVRALESGPLRRLTDRGQNITLILAVKWNMSHHKTPILSQRKTNLPYSLKNYYNRREDWRCNIMYFSLSCYTVCIDAPRDSMSSTLFVLFTPDLENAFTLWKREIKNSLKARDDAFGKGRWGSHAPDNTYLGSVQFGNNILLHFPAILTIGRHLNVDCRLLGLSRTFFINKYTYTCITSSYDCWISLFFLSFLVWL